jgi:diguanylate cyclase (GGDEF)-like protein
MSSIFTAQLQDVREGPRRKRRPPFAVLIVLLTTNALVATMLAMGRLLDPQDIRLAGAVSIAAMLVALFHHRARIDALTRELDDALHRDRLTGLANRELFTRQLDASLERVRRGHQPVLAVLLLDFDHFKLVNDALGHQAGDALLQQISMRLRQALGGAAAGNHIARFGGDEFLVLLQDLHHVADAQLIADGLLRELLQPFRIMGRDVSVQASIGIAVSDQGQPDAATMLRNADVAMYEAKRAGRACAVMFSDAMHAQLERRLAIESGLRQALGTSQLSLVYQPIVDLDTGKRSSVEALVRWHHPTLGPIAPSEFVPVAEESGLIFPLGEWVMREGCAALARWQKLDPEEAPGAVSINVSRAQLARGPQLLHTVRAALQAERLSPRCLQLEVTEREVMRDPAASLTLMHELRDIGVRLAMDDFGAGTSSLGCLSEYPFDVIKIDRSFINGLTGDPDRLAVLHATITLVENLGKSSVGEGVETIEQLATLQAMGCHFAQGYHLGKPMTEAEFTGAERTLTIPRLQMLG